mgnify:CR=1 FL=1
MKAAGTGTRDRILDASLKLFNEEGVAKVSTHRIAAEIGISPGNLHYHFKTKQQIVVWLFRRFENRVTPCIDAAATVTALDDLWLSLHIDVQAVSEYRFVYRDVDYVLNEFPELEVRAQALTAKKPAGVKGLVFRAWLPPASLRQQPRTWRCSRCSSSSRRLAGSRSSASRHPPAASMPKPHWLPYYTLTILSPYVVGEARDYLNYLRAKYLR